MEACGGQKVASAVCPFSLNTTIFTLSSPGIVGFMGAERVRTRTYNAILVFQIYMIIR